mmetsp:Transcript_29386/g.47128  ORF Transcript_29386/g.47128 Transcript_29386/m.47128 type:complete len:307 (-) Transcript_29386:424-1344(-)
MLILFKTRLGVLEWSSKITSLSQNTISLLYNNLNINNYKLIFLSHNIIKLSNMYDLSLDNSYQRFFFNHTINNSNYSSIMKDSNSKYVLIFTTCKINQIIKDFYIVKKSFLKKLKDQNKVINIAFIVKGSSILDSLQKLSYKKSFKKNYIFPIKIYLKKNIFNQNSQFKNITLNFFYDIERFFRFTCKNWQTNNKKRITKYKTSFLEILKDLPKYNILPSEKSLFVCKLSPLTQEKDMENIFKRYGKITSIKIIKEKKSEKSLNYGFIEYASRKSCENAFFNSQNIYIDDCHIVVKFSQSIFKLIN